jgi:hypothetical protein
MSLRVLARQMQSGTPVKQAVDCCGIGWVEGYVTDPDNQDIILVGQHSSKWPLVKLDDLVVHIRNVWNREPCPFCSLDPQNQDVLKVNKLFADIGRISGIEEMRNLVRRLKQLWGPQTAVLGGVPRHSRLSHVMIDADYHMKKLSQGLVEVSVVPSCLDRMVDEAKKQMETGQRAPALGMSMSRFWFHIGANEPTFLEDDGVVWLDKCTVVVLTEKQKATTEGILYDSGGEDPYARAFARDLSDGFPQAAAVVPFYADLWNQYRLSSLLRGMHFRQPPELAKLDLDAYLKRFVYLLESAMPPSLPGLVNSKEVNETFQKGDMVYQWFAMPLACGGVSMDIRVKENQFRKDRSKRLEKLRQAAIRCRPSVDTLCWPLVGTP